MGGVLSDTVLHVYSGVSDSLRPHRRSQPGSSVHGIFQAWILEWLPFPWDLPDPGMELESPVSPALAGGFFTTKPTGKPRDGVEGGRKQRGRVFLFSGRAGWPHPGLFPNHAHAFL